MVARDGCCLVARVQYYPNLGLDIIDMIHNYAHTLIDNRKAAKRTIRKRHIEGSQSAIYSKPQV